jgi:hypothetical protein
MILTAILLAVPATMWWACLAFFLQRWIALAAFWGVPVGAAAALLTAAAVLTGAAGRPRLLTPRAATRKVVPQLPEPAPLDFAWPVYFFEQWHYDVAEIVRLAGRGAVDGWRTAWHLVPSGPNIVRRIVADGPHMSPTRWTTWAVLGPLLLVPTAFLVGATAGALAVVTLVVVVATALWLVTFLLCAAGVGLMVAWSRACRQWNRAEAYCTRCFHRAELPAYACPGPHPDAHDAERLHRRLRPGVLGIWWHRCGCGQLLPTTPRRVARLLPAVCPACRAPMHSGAGWSRDVRIAVFGGAQAGKTAMVAGAVRAYTSVPAAPAALQTLPAAAAPVAAESAVTLRFPGRRRPALVHLFDSRGDDLLDPQRRQKLTYLDDASSLILALDPFSLPGLRLALEQVSASVRPAVEPADDDPDDAYRAMVDALRFHGAVARKRLAVVLTKYDALALLDRERMDADSNAVRAWLKRHGLGKIVFSADRDFREVRYFRTAADALDEVVDPLNWILREEGVTTGIRHG